MRSRYEHLLFPVAAASLLLAACDGTSEPTGPVGEAGSATTAAAVTAAAVPTTPNTWGARAAIEPNGNFYGFTAGAAKNAAGQWLVYAFRGGTDEGGSNWPVRAYNVATNTWTQKQPRVALSIRWNGVGVIGNTMYYTGGWTWDEPGAQFGNKLWAYDFTTDKQVTLANLPRYTADGVTGVYQGKILYVLPGTCSGEGWPFAGYCANEPFHRLYRYDPATNKWGTRRQSLYFHRGGAGAFVDSKFYVVGGGDSISTTNTWRLESYDPTTDHWTAHASMPSGGTTINECISGTPCLFAQVLGQQLWVLTRDHRLLMYDTATNKWTTKAKLPAATVPQDMVRVAIGAQAYLFVIGAGASPSQLYRP
jgi:Kelch motif